MRRSLVALIAFLSVLATAHNDALGARLSQTLPSPDRALSASITPVGRERKESRMGIEKSDGTSLCTRDYSSADG
jgi:hypothetical protein